MTLEAGKLYTPTSPEMVPIAKEQTLAAWRHYGKGPAYIKSGTRVLYRGADVLAWLEAQLVEPQAAA